MNPRSIRRAAERKTLKQTLKETRQNTQENEHPLAALLSEGGSKAVSNHVPESFPQHFAALCASLDRIKAAAKTRTSEARLAINRANAQLSTGPTSPEGKAVSCLNNTKFGLTGARFTVLAWEDRTEFDKLLNGLRDEHQPSTPTEQILVEDMAQHHWLSQRALLLQNLCFEIEEPACESPARQKELALYIRYQTTHQRAFHKCLDQLLKIRAARQKEVGGFESQKQKEAEEVRKQETHHARVRIAKARAEYHEMRNASPKEPVSDAPITPETSQAAA